MNDRFTDLSNKIVKYSKKIWYPNNGIKNSRSTNSWFHIDEYINPNKNKIIRNNTHTQSKNLIRCDKIQFFPNGIQRKILLNWFEFSRKMFNETIKYFRMKRFFKLKPTYSGNKLADGELKQIKKDLIAKSNNINSHVIRGAIKMAVNSYKSCLTNFKCKNIKRFRIRYLKKNKNTKILHIEHKFIHKSKNTFCSRVFKDPFRCKNNFKLQNIKKDFIIHYNVRNNKFHFLVPIEVIPKKIHNNKDTISLDPGIRTFMMGYSTKKCVDIGSNMYIKIKKYLRKIDKTRKSKHITEKKV